jgi:monoamine oxidase
MSPLRTDETGLSKQEIKYSVGHKKQSVVIIGAGLAGLTAALELCRQSDIKPIVLEASDRIGGISCTIRYNGNRIDEVRDSCVFRVPKTCPAYFGTYDRFDEIVRYMERYENLSTTPRESDLSDEEFVA